MLFLGRRKENDQGLHETAFVIGIIFPAGHHDDALWG
jgi:hypothetical protein